MSSTIVTVLTLVILLWIILTLIFSFEKITGDKLLVQNYHRKQSFQKRLVLIIESFPNLESLLTLIRNVLHQDIKVDSIILITKNKEIEKVELVQNTCVINQVGGLSFILKESGNDTILVYIFPEGFKAFQKPHFLKNFLLSKTKVNGIVVTETGSTKVDIHKIYE